MTYKEKHAMLQESSCNWLISLYFLEKLICGPLFIVKFTKLCILEFMLTFFTSNSATCTISNSRPETLHLENERSFSGEVKNVSINF